MVKKVESKKTTKKATKKVTKKESFFKEVKKELAKVKWPKASEVLKYTIATVVLVLIVIAFFSLLNLLLSFIKGLFV
ncbi:MAG: preprotein translocase subunit SecE [Bacilli bacterium]|nr:preprotein translocase subunit SecE [Bacilli bacterium]